MRNHMPPPVSRSASPHLGAPRYQTGFTLVELMIAITLGLIVLLAIGSIYIGSRQTYRVQEDNARLQEAGRYALDVIGRSLRQAGADSEMSFNSAMINPVCSVAGVCIPVTGTNGAGSAPDTMTIQFYAGRDEFDSVNWIARDCTGGLVTFVPAGVVITNIIDTGADAGSLATGTALRCTGAAAAQELVSDIEDLQVIYGIDTTGDESADQYVAAPSAAQWIQVVTARVCVLIQSANNGLTVAPQRYLNCAGALGTATGAAAFTTAGAGDLRLHRSFAATYNLRNRISLAP